MQLQPNLESTNTISGRQDAALNNNVRFVLVFFTHKICLQTTSTAVVDVDVDVCIHTQRNIRPVGVVYLVPGRVALQELKKTSECWQRRYFLAGSLCGCWELRAVRNRHPAAAAAAENGDAAAGLGGG